MTELEKYRFDLEGYLLVENVLSKSEIDELNSLVTERLAKLPEDALSQAMYAGLNGDYGDGKASSGPKHHVGPILHWGRAMQNLINHPKVVPYVQEFVGPKFRLDHQYGIFSKGGETALRLHGGATPYNDGFSYHVAGGRIYAGTMVVSFALVDVKAGDGGFCCVPGTHKANFPLPKNVDNQDASSPIVRQAPQPVGSVIMFTEALTHGTMPWRPNRERRSLLFKYCPPYASYYKRNPAIPGLNGAKLSDEQWEILREPSVANREVLGFEQFVAEGAKGR